MRRHTRLTTDSHTGRFVIKAALLLTATWAGTGVAGELSDYTYRVAKNNDPVVCEHMRKVYNAHFRRPFDPRLTRRLDKESLVPVESRYPTSPEFDAVNWELRRYPFTFADQKGYLNVLISHLDIDNDGARDLVVKTSFFDGTPDASEQLSVFRAKEFNVQNVVDGGEFLVGQTPKHGPRIIFTNAAISRPFVYKGVTYLSDYYFAREEDRRAGGVFNPPEYMKVHRFLGGGEVDGKTRAPLRMQEVCVFRMLSRNEK